MLMMLCRLLDGRVHATSIRKKTEALAVAGEEIGQEVNCEQTK